MAQQLNYTGAFATVKPVERDLAQDLIDNDLKFKADRRLQEAHNEEKAKADAEKKQALRDKYNVSLKYTPSGIQTLDEYQIASIKMAQEQIGKDAIRASILSNKSNLTPEENEELIKIEIRNKNAKNFGDNLKNFTTSAQEQYNEKVKGMLEGKYFTDQSLLERGKVGLSAFKPSVDEFLMPTAGFGNLDADGDGDFDEISWANINEGLAFKAMPRVDANKLASETAKGIGVLDEKYNQGNYTTVEKKGFVDQYFQDAVDGVFNNEQAVKSFIREFNITNKEGKPDYENPSIESITKAKEIFSKMVRSHEDLKDYSTEDLAAQDRDAARSQAAAEKAKDRALRVSEGDKNRANKLAISKKGKGGAQTEVNISDIALSGRTKEGNKTVPKGTLNFGTGGGLSLNPTPGEYHIIDKVRLTPSGNLMLEGYIDYKDNNGKILKPRKKILLNSSKDEAEMTKYSTNFKKENGESFSSTTEFLKAVKSKVDGKNIVPVGKSESDSQDLSTKKYKGVDDSGNPIWE